MATFDEFEAVVQEFEQADPGSLSFRYPVKKDLTGAVNGHLAFSVREFARTMDDVLDTLSGAFDCVDEIADNRAQAAYEAHCEDMSQGQPTDFESL